MYDKETLRKMYSASKTQHRVCVTHLLYVQKHQTRKISIKKGINLSTILSFSSKFLQPAVFKIIRYHAAAVARILSNLFQT